MDEKRTSIIKHRYIGLKSKQAKSFNDAYRSIPSGPPVSRVRQVVNRNRLSCRWSMNKLAFANINTAVGRTWPIPFKKNQISRLEIIL